MLDMITQYIAAEIHSLTVFAQEFDLVRDSCHSSFIVSLCIQCTWRKSISKALLTIKWGLEAHSDSQASQQEASSLCFIYICLHRAPLPLITGSHTYI